MKKICLLILFSVLFYGGDSLAQITGITPNAAQLGTNNLTTTITTNGMFMVQATQWGNLWDAHLKQGTAQITLFSQFGFNATVTDPDTATIVGVNIPANATLGLYDLIVITSDPFGNPNVYDTLMNAFTVQPPDGYLQGHIFEDINVNGIQDNGEPPLSNRLVNVVPGGSGYLTDSAGNFSIPVANGVHTVNTFNNSDSMIVTTDSLSYTVTVNNGNVTGLNFGLSRKILGLAPTQSIGGRTVSFTVHTLGLFLGTGQGNVSYIQLLKPNFGSYIGSNIQVIDSNDATFTVNFPANAPIGMYRILITLTGNGGAHSKPDVFEIIPYESYLTGTVYFDVNGNGLYDSLEPPVPSQRVTIAPDSGYVFSSSTGYSFGVLNGQHTVAWSPNSAEFTLSSDSASYTVNNSGSLGGLDFGLTTTNPDYTGTIYYAEGWPRCYNHTNEYIRVMNRSNTAFHGEVVLILDPNIAYINANITPSSINGDTLIWDFPSMTPYSEVAINVTIQMPGPGFTVTSTATFNTYDPSNVLQTTYTSYSSQWVRCSFDPNDKSVIPEGVDNAHYTLIGDELEYLIRFQNTGNDTAYDITIYDQLSQDIDLSTFAVIGSSNSVNTEVRADRQAVFTFSHIMLPDSNIDEPGSHGFVSYRVKANAGIQEYTAIDNTAFIVFDQNAPVVTNTTSNTMVSMIPVSVIEAVKKSGNAIVYPNPFSVNATLLFKNELKRKFVFEMTDVEGRILRKETTDSDRLQLSGNGLSSGVYFYKLISTDDGTIQSGKFIIE